ncbi:Proteasome assembly chaperone 2 [Dispira simplex]|nr:Proteasome assembly chaperone 2 [Dispira simplex]
MTHGTYDVDLLISTLRLQRVGILNDPTVIPVMGPPAFGHSKDTLSLSLEVYQSPDHHITVLQQRAPSLPKQQRTFVANLTKFIQVHQFSHTVVLASVDASLRNDQQLARGPLLLLPTEMSPLPFVTQATELGIEVLEKELTKQYPRKLTRSPEGGQPSGNAVLKPGSSEETVSPATSNIDTLTGEYAQLNIRGQSEIPIFGRQVPSPYLPGGGIARRLHQLGQKRHLPLTMLLEFVAEGHNIPEAVTMANCLRVLLPSLFTVSSPDEALGKST